MELVNVVSVAEKYKWQWRAHVGMIRDKRLHNGRLEYRSRGRRNVGRPER
jgi:hypothetical protein